MLHYSSHQVSSRLFTPFHSARLGFLDSYFSFIRLAASEVQEHLQISLDSAQPTWFIIRNLKVINQKPGAAPEWISRLVGMIFWAYKCVNSSLERLSEAQNLNKRARARIGSAMWETGWQKRSPGCLRWRWWWWCNMTDERASERERWFEMTDDGFLFRRARPETKRLVNIGITNINYFLLFLLLLLVLLIESSIFGSELGPGSHSTNCLFLDLAQSFPSPWYGHKAEAWQETREDWDPASEGWLVHCKSKHGLFFYILCFITTLLRLSQIECGKRLSVATMLRLPVLVMQYIHTMSPRNKGEG